MTATSVFHDYVLDPLERAASTFVQQFGVLVIPLLVIMTNGKLGFTAAQLEAAADMAGFAAIISIITSVITFPIPKLSAAADLVLRVIKTYLQSFLATITTAAWVPSVLHADWKVALVAAIPVAGVALLKGLAALAAPWSEGASLLPANAGVDHGVHEAAA